jgi:hypothetical protein
MTTRGKPEMKSASVNGLPEMKRKSKTFQKPGSVYFITYSSNSWRSDSETITLPLAIAVTASGV